jgi:hypothetical protein
MLLAIDADSMVYAYGFAYEGKPLAFAQKGISKQIEKLAEVADADHIKLFLGGVGNFRNDIAVTYPYKGTRSKDKPEHYHGLREYLYEVYDTTMCDGFEADDAVSLLLWEEYKRVGSEDISNLIVASVDKDIRNTPGLHMNSKTCVIDYFNEREADYNFYLQLLMGDSTDNIKGLPYCSPAVVKAYDLHNSALKGCGRKSAERILDRPFDRSEDMYSLIRGAYLSWGICEGYSTESVEEYLLEQGRLLWMSRELDEDFNPVLWELPKEK